MGMYDEIVCDYQLPGTPPVYIRPGHRFQTKDLECALDTHTISADGTFSLEKYTGALEFYTNNICASGPGLYTSDGTDADSVTYAAQFVDGKLRSLVETEREVQPALHGSEMWSIARAVEEGASRKQDDFDYDKLVGRRMYVMWGGQDEGYYVDVVTETERQWCVKKTTGVLELIDRQIAPGRTFFCSEEVAKARRKARHDKWQAEKEEFNRRVALRSNQPVASQPEK